MQKKKTDTTRTARSTRRYTLLTAAALRDGWPKYSTALTDWLHGRARLVRVDELTETAGDVSEAEKDGAR